jgi:hypothetical protein
MTERASQMVARKMEASSRFRGEIVPGVASPPFVAKDVRVGARRQGLSAP